MIAWFIRFGTAIFGDTNLGVRFAGILAMAVTQLLLADIVRRVTHNMRAVILAVLMPEAALYYGLLMAKVSPGHCADPVRGRDDLGAGAARRERRSRAGGSPPACSAGWRCCRNSPSSCCCCRRSLAFMLVPDWRRRWLSSPYPWARRADRAARVLAGPDLECAARLGFVQIPAGARHRAA